MREVATRVSALRIRQRTRAHPPNPSRSPHQPRTVHWGTRCAAPTARTELLADGRPDHSHFLWHHDRPLRPRSPAGSRTASVTGTSTATLHATHPQQHTQLLARVMAWVLCAGHRTVTRRIVPFRAARPPRVCLLQIRVKTTMSWLPLN